MHGTDATFLRENFTTGGRRMNIIKIVFDVISFAFKHRTNYLLGEFHFYGGIWQAGNFMSIELNGLLRNSKKAYKPNSEQFEVIERSNVIQFDEMGYPLRLVMINLGNGTVDHVWRDTTEREDDVVLEWTKI